MTDTILPKKIRHERGIIQTWSKRHRDMRWGFDTRIGEKRFRAGGCETRAEAEAKLAQLQMRERCEQFGIPVDGKYIGAERLWHEVEAIASTKIGAIGAATELLVCADLLRRGYDVYRAVASNADCDIILLKGNLACRVEVKSAVMRQGRVTFKSHRLDCKKYEILALVFLREFRIEYRPDPAALLEKHEPAALSVSDL